MANTRLPASLPPTSRPRRTRGQSLAELVLVLPLLLLIVLGGLDAGRLFVGWINLASAARIAANYAALHPAAAWSDPADPDAARYAGLVRAQAGSSGCALQDPLPWPAYPAGTDLGDDAVVRLTCEVVPITPMLGTILGASVTLAASATFPVRAGGIVDALPTPTPTPDPLPTPTPAASPGPTPTPCAATVPVLTGLRVNTARTLWTTAGFSGTVTASGSGNFIVAWQGLAAGSTASCTAPITLADRLP